MRIHAEPRGVVHVALVGDSTLDNGAYTDGGLDVAEQLRRGLGEPHAVSLLARDGDTTWDVAAQLSSISRATSHVVLSVGGNDALQHLDLFARPVTTVGEAMSEFARVISSFDQNYRTCLQRVLDLGRPTIVCTVYNGAFPPEQRDVIACAVRLFDDVIIQAASDGGCPVLDLRRTCDQDTDYWNPIEPNARGGGKIAAALASILRAGSPPGLYPQRRHL